MASSVGAFWGVVALVVWLPIVVVGIMLRNWARLIGAVVLLLATVGLGLAGDHWDRVDLVILGAGVGVVAAFVGTFACSRRPPPPLPAMPRRGVLTPASSALVADLPLPALTRRTVNRWRR